MTMFITKMNEAFEILTGALREVAETLNKLFGCFSEDEKEEKTFISSPRQYGIFLKNNHQIYSRSLYKPPFVQVPRHLAYQRRHYQS